MIGHDCVRSSWPHRCMTAAQRRKRKLTIGPGFDGHVEREEEDKRGRVAEFMPRLATGTPRRLRQVVARLLEVCQQLG